MGDWCSINGWCPRGKEEMQKEIVALREEVERMRGVVEAAEDVARFLDTQGAINEFFASTSKMSQIVSTYRAQSCPTDEGEEGER
jgi:P2-related tail formation protein